MTDLDALRNDREPVKQACAMASAIARFLDDLKTDDPGDDDGRMMFLIEKASVNADALVNALTEVIRDHE